MRAVRSFPSVAAIGLLIGVGSACGAKLELAPRPPLGFHNWDAGGELVKPHPVTPQPPANARLTHKAVHQDPDWTLQVNAYGGEFYSKPTGHRTLTGTGLFETEQSWLILGPGRPADGARAEVRVTTQPCNDGRGVKTAKNGTRYRVVVNGVDGCLRPIPWRSSAEEGQGYR